MNQLAHDNTKGNIRYTAYRWYFPSRALNWASINGTYFHHWIVHLKDDLKHDIVHRFFESILIEYVRLSGVDIDLIISIPPSKSYEERSSYPLASIAANVNKDRGFLFLTVKVPNPG